MPIPTRYLLPDRCSFKSAPADRPGGSPKLTPVYNPKPYDLGTTFGRWMIDTDNTAPWDDEIADRPPCMPHTLTLVHDSGGLPSITSFQFYLYEAGTLAGRLSILQQAIREPAVTKDDLIDLTRTLYDMFDGVAKSKDHALDLLYARIDADCAPNYITR